MLNANDVAIIQEIVRRELTGSIISKTMRSNLFTMGAVAQIDPDKAVLGKPGIPSAKVRMLRARLLFEECIETMKGLGIAYQMHQLVDVSEPSLEAIIDGCCDLIYVAVGTLAACGVPDIPHLELVNRTNNAKFPGGVATVDEHGKFQKPEGWKPPVHADLYETQSVDIKTLVK